MSRPAPSAAARALAGFLGVRPDRVELGFRVAAEVRRRLEPSVEPPPPLVAAGAPAPGSGRLEALGIRPEVIETTAEPLDG